MRLPIQQGVARLAVWLTLFSPLHIGVSYAQDHVVPFAELQGELESRSAEKSKNIADIERALSHPTAQDLLNKAQIRPAQVQRAISMLSPEELSRLGARARSAEHDVEGGLLVGLLALIGLVVVIIIVITVLKDDNAPAY